MNNFYLSGVEVAYKEIQIKTWESALKRFKHKGIQTVLIVSRNDSNTKAMKLKRAREKNPEFYQGFLFALFGSHDPYFENDFESFQAGFNDTVNLLLEQGHLTMETSTNTKPTIHERLEIFWNWVKQTQTNLRRRYPNLFGILEKFIEIMLVILLLAAMLGTGAFLLWLPAEYGWTGGGIAVVLAALIYAIYDHYRKY